PSLHDALPIFLLGIPPNSRIEALGECLGLEDGDEAVRVGGSQSGRTRTTRSDVDFRVAFGFRIEVSLVKGEMFAIVAEEVLVCPKASNDIEGFLQTVTADRIFRPV